MAGLKLKDNVFADLNDTIGTGDSRSSATFALAAGHGARLPTLDANDILYLDLINTAGQIERWFIHSVSTDDVVATGEQGGTTAKAFAPGDRVEIRWHTLHAAEKEDLAGLNTILATAGTEDALTASLVTRLSALVDGMRIRIKVGASPNAAETPTLNLTLDATSLGGSTTATGAKSIVLQGNNFAGPGALAANAIADLIYNSTYSAWVVSNPAGGLDAPGTLKMHMGSSLPAGAWFACDATVKAEASYPQLFALVGTAFNRGDEGAGNFRLPDMRGRTPVGVGTGVTVEHVTASSANGFTVDANNTKLITGMPVVLSNLSGFTTAATEGPTYYIYRASATNVRLCSTLAIAQNATTGSMVTISGTGTATLTCALTARALGEDGGEEGHAMSLTEMLAHTHQAQLAALIINNGAVANGWYNDGTSNFATGSRGGNAAMNIMQPFLGVNFIIRF